MPEYVLAIGDARRYHIGMNYAKPYRLKERRLATVTTWYYAPAGGKWQSTGIGYTNPKDRAKTRRQAEKYCLELVAAGRLAQATAPTLSSWIAEQHFWDWHRSTYVRSRLARSSRARPGITELYVRKSAAATETHVLPYHGHLRIDEITPQHLETLLFSWVAPPLSLSHKTANNLRTIYSVVLAEAARLGVIDHNPWQRVPALSYDANPHGAISIDVAKALVSGDMPTKPAQMMYQTAIHLALFTGMRVAEITGLHTDDVMDYSRQVDGATITYSYLQVSRQWNDRTKRRELTKDKETRQIPILPQLREMLDPYLHQAGFVFSHDPQKRTPISQCKLRGYLYKRMDALGISRTDANGRVITFHSTRRFFNTLLRHGRVSDDVIRRFTGHDSAEMTDHYTDYLPEDMAAISDAQRLLTDQ